MVNFRHRWRQVAFGQVPARLVGSMASHPSVWRNGWPSLGSGTTEPVVLHACRWQDHYNRTWRSKPVPEADNRRVTIGHAEGMPLAFANIYQNSTE